MRHFQVNKHRVEGDTVFIKLTQGRETRVSLTDWPLVSQFTWHAILSKGSAAYAMTTLRKSPHDIKAKNMSLQSLLHPEWGMVDHKDRDTLNNLDWNLREATHVTNGQNRKRHKNSKTGFKGVKRGRYSFEARITVIGKLVHLGCAATAEGAARIYDAAAEKHFGEFAVLNFPKT